MLQVRYLFAILFLGLTVSVCAQVSDAPLYAHTLYRSDGSVLKGEIIAWTGEHVEFRLLSGVTMRVHHADIRKIVSRNVPKPVDRIQTGRERSYLFNEEGMYNVTTVAVSAGPYAALGATHAIGHQFSRLFGMGAGIGIESFDVGSGKEIVPLFADFRGYFMKRNISPYYALRTGYGFAVKDEEAGVVDANGGLLFQAELGYRFSASRAVNFFAGVGVHFQRASYEYLFPWESRAFDRITYRRTELRFGVMF